MFFFVIYFLDSGNLVAVFVFRGHGKKFIFPINSFRCFRGSGESSGCSPCKVSGLPVYLRIVLVQPGKPKNDLLLS